MIDFLMITSRNTKRGVEIYPKFIIKKSNAQFREPDIVSVLCFVHTMLVLPLSILLYLPDVGFWSMAALVVWVLYYFSFLSSLTRIQNCGADEVTAGRLMKIYGVVLTVITVNAAFLGLALGAACVCSL